MKRKSDTIARPPLEKRILTIRGEKVILDADLAEVYGVPTGRLTEQYRRNRQRFPEDFAFRLSAREWAVLRSQIAASNAEHPQNKYVAPNSPQFADSSRRHRGAAYRPIAFTEHGALMAATILNSSRAIQMSVFVIRAFLKMRAALGDTRALAQKLSALEQELKGRLDLHEAAIVDVLQRIMRILDPPAATPEPPDPPKPEIGFHVKESSPPYRVKRKPARA